MLKAIKRGVGRAVLRGPALRAWHLRQCERLDLAYRRKLIQAAEQAATPSSKVSFGPPGQVRRILLIADVMWETNELVPELQRIGEVAVLDLHPALKNRRNHEAAPEVVASAVKGFIDAQTGAEPDVILFYARGSILSEEVFHHLRKRWKCPLFGMNLDDKVTFFEYHVLSSGDDNYQHWAGKFDLNLTSSLTAREWYVRRGLPCHYIAMGFHQQPQFSEPPKSSRYEHKLSFVGSRRPERQRIVDELARAGVPVALFGTGWRGSQWIDNPAAAYRKSQMNLGVGFATSTGGIVNLKARDFECPGAGACYLTTYHWELAAHYDIGREILCYRSPEELLELYYFYAVRPEDCLRIAQAAHRRCAAEHTWEKRFRAIFRETGLTG